MVSWALVLETAIKWLIPTILIAIMGFITLKLINPLKKVISNNQQEQWDTCMKNSKLPEAFCQNTYNRLKEESDVKDDEILAKIDTLMSAMNTANEQSKVYHKKVDEQIDNLRLGVLDTHLQGLIATCETYIKRGYITAVEMQAYQDRLNIYHKLGGNGHMDVWDEKIRSLPNEPPKSKSYITTNTQPPITHK